MNLDGFVERMRRRQAALMSTSVAVTRFSGEGAFDPDTASYAPPVAEPVYSGPALVRPTATAVDESGQTTVVVDTWTVKLPVDSAVEIVDAIEVTGSTHDAGLVGVVLRISSVRYDEWQIARVATAVAESDRPT